MKGYFMDNTQGPVESVENIHRFPKIETYFFPYGLSLSTNHCFFVCYLISCFFGHKMHSGNMQCSMGACGPHPTMWRGFTLQLLGSPS